MTEDVISAISTPAGCGGVAIIRMSGEGCLEIARRVFTPANGRACPFVPNVMYAGNIDCGDFADFGMCVYFKAPKSFTGEDVIELHCHGGVRIARGVLDATVKAGARPAERGEFTRRAFVNGKLSLSSCEGMIDMINAQSTAEVRAGSLLYRERLTEEVNKIQQKLKDVLAKIAADTDYPEEGIEETERGPIAQALGEAERAANALVEAYYGGKYIKSGVCVAICGAPNVGKSSLLNALLGYDKAIVSPVAGTTRDVVEGAVNRGGIIFNFTDTAGIRSGAGEIEKMGIERAKKALSSADVVVCLSDNGDFSAAEGVERERLIRAFSKCDIKRGKGDFDVAISSKTGEGIEELKALIEGKSTGGRSLEGAFVIEERHYDALRRARDRAAAALENMKSYPLDLVSMDVRECWRILGEITGETADEDIIDTVFQKFCVGK